MGDRNALPVFEGVRSHSDVSYRGLARILVIGHATWTEGLREGGQQMDGKYQEVAHGVNRIMAVRARKTAPHGRIPSYCDCKSVALTTDRIEYQRGRDTIMNPVELLDGTAGMHPSGMGSYSYASSFRVVVDNIEYAKNVGIWGRHATTGVWYFTPGTFERQVPGNREVWHVTTGPVDQFAVKYDVGGATFWDNNGGFDYRIDVAAASSTDGVGSAVLGPRVINIGGYVDSSSLLVVSVAVKNIAYVKQVGIVYTADGGTNWLAAPGSYERSYPPASAPGQAQVEMWQIKASVPGGAKPTFAVFYTANGDTAWDNNFGQNFKAS